MKFKSVASLFFVLAVVPAGVCGAASTPPPGYEADLPANYTPVPGQILQLPEFLPNGAVNLDEAWIQDGGARLYWNSVRIPQQIKLAGVPWVDPASVPDLFPAPVKQQPRKRYYKKRTKRVAKVKVPANVSSTALTPPAIPVPVTPVSEAAKPVQKIAPLKAAKPARRVAQRKAAPARTAPEQIPQPPISTDFTPPRLQ